jgi:hypothetical protein
MTDKPLQRLYHIKLLGRWLFVLAAWLTLAPWALWQLREDIGLWQQHFTWVAIRYGLAFQWQATFSLFFCVGITGSTLVWHSLHLIRGFSAQERIRLQRQVESIEARGPSHPLWRWLFRL